MTFLKEEKTNWKYILVVVISAIVVGGGILGYYYGWLQKQEIFLTKFPKIEKPESAWIPEEFVIYQDYLKVIGGESRVGDTGIIEAMVTAVTKSEVCPYPEETCSIEPYPKDIGVVKVDKIYNYTLYSEQKLPTEEPGGEQSEGVVTTPGYTGQELPEPKPLKYEPLQVGQEVPISFLLTTRPTKVRYITVFVPKSGIETTQILEEISPEQSVAHPTEPEKKVFKPIPKEPPYPDLPTTEDYYYVFTTKVFYSEVEKGKPVPEFEITREEVLPSLEVGDKFIAGIRYNGTLYVEEYNIVGLKRITTNEAQQSRPAIYGNKIVWDDNRNGNFDIYMYDLGTNQEIQVTADISNQSSPDIYKNKIVYGDDRNGRIDTYMYDIKTKQETRITKEVSRPLAPAKIYENKIIWADGRNGNWDIYMYDLETGQEIQISSGSKWAGGYAIHDDKIVYEYMVDYKIDIYLYDLKTGKAECISCVFPNSQMSPDIYENKIVWLDYNPPHVNGDVFVYDINTKNQTQITFDDLIHQFNPQVYGQQIVWVDQRNGVEDIYMYDLETEQEKRITKDPSSQQVAAIYENKIVWQDNRNKGQWDIYLYEIVK